MLPASEINLPFLSTNPSSWKGSYDLLVSGQKIYSNKLLVSMEFVNIDSHSKSYTN